MQGTTKRQKRGFTTALVLVCCLLFIHIFIKQRASNILSYIVSEVSDGHYKLKVKKVKLKYWPLGVYATDVQLYPTDSLVQSAYYTVFANQASLQLADIWPLITHKGYHIKKIQIYRPVITAISGAGADRQTSAFNERVKEMQGVLLQSLSEFKVDEFDMDDGSIYYRQKIPGIRPLYINHITLSIDSLRTEKVADEKYANANNNAFKAQVMLLLNKPVIELPKVGVHMALDRLLLDTKKDIFTVNSLFISGANKQNKVSSIKLLELKLHGLNWNRWLNEGTIELDTLNASNGAMVFDFTDKQPIKWDDVTTNNKKVFITEVPFEIHHTNISKIQYAISANSVNGVTQVKLGGDSLAINNIALDNDTARPIKIGTLAFRVTNYTTDRGNKNTQSGFDKLVIENSNLEFINYHRLLGTDKDGQSNSISIPSLKVINFSLDELLQYRLNADKLILSIPALDIELNDKQHLEDLDGLVAKIAASLNESLNIKQIDINNAAIVLRPKNKPANKISIENLNTEIDAHRLLMSKSVMDIVRSARVLSTSGFKIIGNNFNFFVKNSLLNAAGNGVWIADLKGKVGTKVDLDLQGISLISNGGKLTLKDLQNFEMDAVSIRSGNINISTDVATDYAEGKTKMLGILLHQYDVENININISNKHDLIYLKNVSSSGNNLRIENGLANWERIEATSGEVVWKNSFATIKVASVKLPEEGRISFSEVDIVPKKKNVLINANIPALNVFYKRSPFSRISTLKLNSVTVESPVLDINFDSINAGNEKQIKLSKLNVGELIVNNPKLNMAAHVKGIDLKLHSNVGYVHVYNPMVDFANKILLTDSLRLQLNSPELTIDNSKVYKPSSLFLKAKNISYNNIYKKLEAYVDTVLLRNFSISIDKKNPSEVNNASVGVAGFSYHSSDSLLFKTLLQKRNWWISADTFKLETKQHQLAVYKPFISAFSASIKYDSLSIIPFGNRQFFWGTQSYEKDYITVKFGKTNIEQWSLSPNTEGRLWNYAFNAQKITTDNIFALIEKDKTKKQDSVSYRPLLCKSLMQVPVKFSVDTIEIYNGHLRHNLIAAKTKKEAFIFFDDINGYLYGFKNNSILSDDTLLLRLRSKLMGQSDLTVAFRQSYTDSMQGFWLRSRMGKMNLSTLNPLLFPILSVQINAGKADTMLLLVRGNNLVAYGTMDLRYNDLRMTVAQDGNEKKIRTKFYTWLLNVVVHSKSQKDKKIFFQERLLNKTIYNFWAKIAIKGLLANLGIKRDKNQLRKYKKFIKEHNLPDYSGDQWYGR